MSKKPKPLEQWQREVFEDAFQHSGTCRMECECGKTYYNSNGGWDWADGELETLAADETAIDLPYTVGRITFEGKEYANGCDCWIELAAMIYRFLVAYGPSIADLFDGIKRHMQAEAEGFPVIKDSTCG